MYEANTSPGAASNLADGGPLYPPTTLATSQYNINGWRAVTINLAANRAGGQFIPQISGNQIIVISSDIPVSLVPNSQTFDLPVLGDTNSIFKGSFSGVMLQHADYSAATLPIVLRLLVCQDDSEYVPSQYGAEHGVSLPVNQINQFALGGSSELRFPVPAGARRIKNVCCQVEVTLAAIAAGPALARLVFKRANNSTVVTPNLTGYTGVVAPGKILPLNYITVNPATFVYRLFAEFTDVPIPSCAAEIDVSFSVGPTDTLTAAAAPNASTTAGTCYVE